MLNARQKGQDGEREIADDLNAILRQLHQELGLVYPPKPIVQRNQNQSAVGGCDLVGTYGLAIEVKRQEQLSINTWWAQCVTSAQELKHEPVLLFRQNSQPGTRKMWRCMLHVTLPGTDTVVRAEITYNDFKEFWRTWARKHLRVAMQEGTVDAAPLPLGIIIPEIRRRDPEMDLYAA